MLDTPEIGWYLIQYTSNQANTFKGGGLDSNVARTYQQRGGLARAPSSCC